MPDHEMIAAATQGYSGATNPHIATSPKWYAFCLGRYFLATGRTAPRNVRMGRGYSIRANDMRFLIRHVEADQQGTAAQFERAE